MAMGIFSHSKGEFTYPYRRQCSVHPFPTVKTGPADEGVSLSSFTTAPLVFAPKALKSTLKQSMKEHKQMREGQMEIKGDQGNEDQLMMHICPCPI